MITSQRRSRLLATLAVAVAAGAHVLAQNITLWTTPGWSPSAFRLFGSGDQLSYLAYSSNAAQGDLSMVEPFTQTGASYYPRAYYVLVGLIARMTGTDVTTAWSVTGVVVQVLLVVALGIACILISGRWWTGALAFTPFLLGTMAVVTGQEQWWVKMNAHAVLWGPFGVLYPINGEAFGLCLGAVALLLALLAVTRVAPGRRRLVIGILVSAAIGVLANVQTYSFLSAVYVIVYVIAAYGLTVVRSRALTLTTVALLPVLFVVGNVIPFRGGQLISLMIGLLPAAPALVVLLKRSRGMAAIFAIVAAAFASPTIISVLLGIYGRDEFLLYRVASSRDLGVWPLNGLLAASPALLALIVILIMGVRRRRPLWIAWPVGAVTAWALLSSNDVWGANQEPYRLFIDVYLLVAVVTLPVLLSVVREVIWGDDAPGFDPPLHEAGQVQPIDPIATGINRRWLKMGLAVVGIVAAVSALDWVRFATAPDTGATISYDGPRIDALRAAAEPAADGLIFAGPCVDPLTLKTITGRRVAYLNVGMAWPDHVAEIMAANLYRGDGVYDFDTGEVAGIDYLITDSACDVDWPAEYADHLVAAGSADYGDGRIELWRISYPD